MTIKFYVAQRFKDETLRKDAEGNDVAVTTMTVRLGLCPCPENDAMFPGGEGRGSLELYGLDPAQAETLAPGTHVHADIAAAE